MVGDGDNGYSNGYFSGYFETTINLNVGDTVNVHYGGINNDSGDKRPEFHLHGCSTHGDFYSSWFQGQFLF